MNSKEPNRSCRWDEVLSQQLLSRCGLVAPFRFVKALSQSESGLKLLQNDIVQAWKAFNKAIKSCVKVGVYCGISFLCSKSLTSVSLVIVRLV